MESISTYPIIPDNIQKLINRVNPHILEWISVIEVWFTPPLSSYHIDNWIADAEKTAEMDIFSLDTLSSWEIVQSILDLYDNHFKKLFINLQQSKQQYQSSSTIPNKNTAQIEKVLKAIQTVQRTDTWYQEQYNLLTGSEIGDLFESEASRQSLIWSKIVPKEQKFQNKAVPYEHLTPFDWGHKFEPVVKMILEWKYNIHIAELGRICHPYEPRLAASPDGIITSTTDNDNLNEKLIGCLVEIKCPISRKPDGRIISKYYHQIQLQLAVTELDECIFTEHVFISGNKKEFDPVSSGWVNAVQNGQPHGRIFIVETQESTASDDESRVSHRYEYSPINNLVWEPSLDREREHIVETMPWALGSVSQQHVKADPEWWTKAQPAIRKFWEEVDGKRKEHADGKLAPRTPKRRQNIQPDIQDQICVIKLS